MTTICNLQTYSKVGQMLAVEEATQVLTAATGTQNSLFEDKENGGFFSTQAGQQDIILRLKDGMDGAEPSTNGVSASNLYRLGSLFEDEDYTIRGTRTVQSFASEALEHPFLFTSMMSSIVAGQLGFKNVVICGDDREVQDAINTYRASSRPNISITRLGGIAKSEWLQQRNELLASMNASKSSLQVCYAGCCREFKPAEATEAFS